MASDILAEFEADEKRKIFVVADTYYASPLIMNLCRQNGYNFVSMLKTNGILNAAQKQMNVLSYTKLVFPKKKSNRVIKISSNRYQVHSQKVSLKTTGAVKIVCTRSLSHCTVKRLSLRLILLFRLNQS